MFSPFGDVTQGISNSHNNFPQFFFLHLNFWKFVTNVFFFNLCVYLARLVIDRKTQRPKGFGFVSYKSEVEAQKALKVMDGRVSFYVEKAQFISI